MARFPIAQCSGLCVCMCLCARELMEAKVKIKKYQKVSDEMWKEMHGD